MQTIIDKAATQHNAHKQLLQTELHPDGHQYWKTVTIHTFPSGVEVFVDEAKSTWADGANFEASVQVRRGDGDREKNSLRAARRAKTAVRRIAKTIEADCLMTLTYRDNVTDRNRVYADFKALRARLTSIGPFQYVATIEKQQRGSLHVHIACKQFPFWLKNEYGVRVKSFQLISSMWSRVVGRGNGNVNFTKPRGRNSAHRIASYIAKYVSKSMEENELDSKSYTASRNIERPKPVVLWFSPDTDTWDIISMLAHDFSLRGYTDIAQYADKLNQFYWFAASPP